MNPHRTPAASAGRSARAAPLHRVVLGLVACAIVPSPAVAQRSPAAARLNLTELTLEELMEVEVTTVSKHREKLAHAPAAVFALNGEDLQRGAITTLPDALRLVPGMQVARVDAHNHAISARGFADVFANKLLVLQDGRSLYTPLFSGVFWDAQDTLLDDIERIEVVRGPGATLWGANAVNGVINILTRSAADTQGPLVAVSGGSDPRFAARVRYGGALDRHTHFRVYGKYADFDHSPGLGGRDAPDAWRRGQAGFRVDRVNAAGNILTLQGDAYQGRQDQTYTLPRATPPFVFEQPSNNRFEGANVLGRATLRPTAGGETTVQGYFDYTRRDTAIFGEARRTFDVEAHHRFSLALHEITLGAGFRASDDSVHNTPYITLVPSGRETSLWSAFVQDDIALGKKSHLILGSKFEHNDFTGWEVQPGARLLLTPADPHTLWASIARAVRTPSRAEDDVSLRQITSTPGIHALSSGNRDFDSEVLTAYEAGYRFHARDKFSVDLALFINRYTDLRTTEITAPSILALARLTAPPTPGLPPPTLPLTIEATSGNNLRGQAHGGEIVVAAQIRPGWRVRASYSRLELRLRTTGRTTDVSGQFQGGRSPRHQGYFWTQHDFSKRWRFDGIVRAVDRLRSARIPGYVVLDARLAWRPAEAWEIALAGRNLLDRQHPEFVPTTIFTTPTQTPRSGFMEIKYGF